MKTITVILTVAILSACSSMTPSEKKQWQLFGKAVATTAIQGATQMAINQYATHGYAK